MVLNDAASVTLDGVMYKLVSIEDVPKKQGPYACTAIITEIKLFVLMVKKDLRRVTPQNSIKFNVGTPHHDRR